MNTKKTIKTIGRIGAFGLGWTIGGIVNSIVKPRGAVDTALTLVGSMCIAFMVGTNFAEVYYDVFDEALFESDNDESM